MTSVQQGTLHLAGASIFYRSCGRGLPLLILAGGDADADATDPLRDALAERYRVITYDRRGLSRSRIDPGGRAPDIATHAEDAHLLLAALTDEPAYLFGTSLGGLIGLELVTRHPEQVRMLVAHEVPTRDLLAEAEAEALAAFQQEILEAFHRHGVAAAMQVSAELAGLDPEDREPQIAPAAMTPARERNLAFLFGSDAPQVMAYRLDIPAIDVQARKIVPAAGRSSGRTLLHSSAVALAQMLERPLAEFPGGHTGWLLRPKAFAGRLIEVFVRAEPRDRRLGDGVGRGLDGSG